MALNIVPNAGQTLNQTRDPIRNNFITIDAGFSVDHVPFNTANQGFHNKVTLNLQTITPVFGALNGIWSQLNAVTGQSEIWVKVNQAAGFKQYPVSSSILSTVAAPAVLSAGWAYLPNGILIKWAGNQNANGLTNINFPVGANIPVFTTCFVVLVTEADGAGGDTDHYVRVQNVQPTFFTAFGSQRTAVGAQNVVFEYLAIGY